jgi:hypothetical protein
VAASAAEKAILEHRARFKANERRAAEHREEDAAEDRLRSGRAPRGHRGK